MPSSFKRFTATFIQSDVRRFVEGFGWKYEYPETPQPFGESAAAEWEPFDGFQADYELTVPNSLIYDTNFNPKVKTYGGIGRLYFTFQDTIIYQENLIYLKKAINSYSYYIVCPNTNPPAEVVIQTNAVSKIIVELFKPGIKLTVNFRKAFYYQDAPTTP